VGIDARAQGVDEVLNTPHGEDQGEVWPTGGTGPTALAAGEVLAVAESASQNRDEVLAVVGRDAFNWRDDRLRDGRLRAGGGEARSDQERAEDVEFRRRCTWLCRRLRTQIRDDGLDVDVAQMTKDLRGHDDQ